jgi:hypothetical protein
VIPRSQGTTLAVASMAVAKSVRTEIFMVLRSRSAMAVGTWYESTVAMIGE